LFFLINRPKQFFLHINYNKTESVTVSINYFFYFFASSRSRFSSPHSSDSFLTAMGMHLPQEMHLA